jgi:ATP-dependent exoDNAse (exonuclease V) alpha subunit
MVARDSESEANLRTATTYKRGDRLKFLESSKAHGVRSKDYGTVLDIDRMRNLLTVKVAEETITYDPRKERALAKCSVYEEKDLQLAAGDRVQMTAAYKPKALQTRLTGTVEKFDGQEITVALDNGKTARWRLNEFRHIDYAYAMTSHASQSMTVGRTLVHVNTGDSRLRSLVNSTFAYVASSRAQHDLVLFTDSQAGLEKALSRQAEKHTALSHEEIREAAMAAASSAGPL